MYDVTLNTAGKSKKYYCWDSVALSTHVGQELISVSVASNLCLKVNVRIY